MLLLFSPVPDWARRPAPPPAPMSLSMAGPMTITRPRGLATWPTTMATAPALPQAPHYFRQWGKILSKKMLILSFRKLFSSKFFIRSDPWQMVSLSSNCFMRVNHFIPFKVLLGDQVCGRRVHKWQRGLQPRCHQDGWPQQGGHPPSNHGPRPQVSGGKSPCVYKKRFWNIFTKPYLFRQTAVFLPECNQLLSKAFKREKKF